MSGAAVNALQRGHEGRKLSLTSNQLKLVAIAAMAFDHCMIAFIPHEWFLYQFVRLPGKLTAPIMCFFIAEGYHHTSNLKRYMGRILAMAMISHVPFALCMEYDVWAFWEATDVMWSLLFGLIALTVYHKEKWPPWVRLALIALCCLLAYSADWNYIAVLLVLFFGAFHRNKNLQIAAHIGVGSLYWLQAVFYGTSLITRLGVFFSIPLLRCYNGSRGKKNKLIQWGFYWFYPVHLMAIYLFDQLI